MKNIVAITLTVLTLLLLGFLVYTFSPREKDLTAYLPQRFDTSKTLTLFKGEAKTVPDKIRVGASEDQEVEFLVYSAIGHYLDQNDRLGLTVWVEKLEEKDFESFKEKSWERYSAPGRETEGASEKVTLADHEVFLSFRTIKETDDTSKMITMGGGYVFFPEKSTVVSYTFYNPRIYSCEDLTKPDTCLFDKEAVLPTAEDNKKIAETIASNPNL